MSATWAVVALLVVGAALRLVQYSSEASLWLDELALAQAIISTDLVALLTRPLPFDQVAPKGFLLFQKLAVLTLGPGDLALRLSRSCVHCWRCQPSRGWLAAPWPPPVRSSRSCSSPRRRR